MLNGVINVYKEKGYTSHDVVAKMRGIFRQKKIGHTGTLDPDAVGVLPVCLGNATKLCDLLTDRSKEYRAVLRLGIVQPAGRRFGAVLRQQLFDDKTAHTGRIAAAFRALQRLALCVVKPVYVAGAPGLRGRLRIGVKTKLPRERVIKRRWDPHVLQDLSLRVHNDSLFRFRGKRDDIVPVCVNSRRLFGRQRGRHDRRFLYGCRRALRALQRCRRHLLRLRGRRSGRLFPLLCTGGKQQCRRVQQQNQALLLSPHNNTPVVRCLRMILLY